MGQLPPGPWLTKCGKCLAGELKKKLTRTGRQIIELIRRRGRHQLKRIRPLERMRRPFPLALSFYQIETFSKRSSRFVPRTLFERHTDWADA